MKQVTLRAIVFVRQPQIAPIATAAALGPVLGLIAYWVSESGGIILFVSVFTLASLLIGLVASSIQRRSAGLVLQDVTLSIPEFTSLSFVVNNEHKRVAWHLFVETASRVATQPLPPDGGFIREALNSLYTLFESIRNELKTMDPSKAGKRGTVEVFALSMLNYELRPFLTKWHPLLKQFESKLDGPLNDESDWPKANECRIELEKMRKKILLYCRAFGELAGIADVDCFFTDSHSDITGVQN